MDLGTSRGMARLGAEFHPDLDERLYARLHAVAHRCRRSTHADLQTTEVVNHTWLSLSAHGERPDFSTPQGLAYFAGACRKLLVQEARRRLREAQAVRDKATTDADRRSDPVKQWARLLAVHEALDWLSQESDYGPQYCLVAELRYFAEFTTEEIAAWLDVDARTVVRYSGFAKAKLKEFIRHPSRRPCGTRGAQDETAAPSDSG